MVARKKLNEAPDDTLGGGDYFATPRDIKFVRSGCTLLDCVLGGGWPLGRIANIVGDKAVGKTLLAIEAAANFSIQYPKGHIWYREAEAAFDPDYAATLGLPVDKVDFGPDGIGTHWDTVEDIFEDLYKVIELSAKTGEPGLYVIDSLDALSSRAELKRDVEAGSFRLEKQKMLGELFRRLVRDLKTGNISIIFISQIRDKIGAMFGEKHTRSGGKSLDFYASLVVWLSNLGVEYKEIRKVKRAVAVRVKAKCKKNKIGLPFRDCEFDIRFGYGVEDIEASLEWLLEVKRLDKMNLTKDGVGDWLKATNALPREQYAKVAEQVRQTVIASWQEVEQDFLPKRKKYE